MLYENGLIWFYQSNLKVGKSLEKFQAITIEVPQGQSCIARKFSKFNFRGIARNISRYTVNTFLHTGRIQPEISWLEGKHSIQYTVPTELSTLSKSNPNIRDIT